MLKCEANGLNVMSFKLGRLPLDSSSQEYESAESIVTPNKFVIKNVQTGQDNQIFSDTEPIEFFSLIT